MSTGIRLHSIRDRHRGVRGQLLELLPWGVGGRKTGHWTLRYTWPSFHPQKNALGTPHPEGLKIGGPRASTLRPGLARARASREPEHAHLALQGANLGAERFKVALVTTAEFLKILHLGVCPIRISLDIVGYLWILLDIVGDELISLGYLWAK